MLEVQDFQARLRAERVQALRGGAGERELAQQRQLRKRSEIAHGLADQQRINPLLVRMSRETGIGLVCTNDVHYTNAEDAAPHDILLCIQTGKKLADEDRMRYEGGQYYLKSPEEMAQLFPYAPEALENTWKIAQRCHVTIEFGVTKLPRYDVPEGLSAWEYLNRLCREGLQQRYHPVTQELEERLSTEGK